MLARNLMQSDVATLRPDMTLREMAVLLSEEQVHGAPVVDGAGRLIGVASHTDLVRAVSQEDEPSFPGGSFFNFGGPEGKALGSDPAMPSGSVSDEMTVSDIMSRDVVTATEDATAGELAELMLAEDVLRVIITRNDRLVGLVSASDLLRVLVAWQAER